MGSSLRRPVRVNPPDGETRPTAPSAGVSHRGDRQIRPHTSGAAAADTGGGERTGEQGAVMENVALMQLVDDVRDLPLTVSEVLAQVIHGMRQRGRVGVEPRADHGRRPGPGGHGAEARQLRLLRLRPQDRVAARTRSCCSASPRSRTSPSPPRSRASWRRIGTSSPAFRRSIFDHSLCTAIGARVLGRARRISGEKAFVAGLLHDLGLIVLVCYRKELFRQLVDTMEARQVGVHEVEEEILRLLARGARRPRRGRVEVPARRSARRCATTTTRRRPSSIRAWRSRCTPATGSPSASTSASCRRSCPSGRTSSRRPSSS